MYAPDWLGFTTPKPTNLQGAIILNRTDIPNYYSTPISRITPAFLSRLPDTSGSLNIERIHPPEVPGVFPSPPRAQPESIQLQEPDLGGTIQTIPPPAIPQHTQQTIPSVSDISPTFIHDNQAELVNAVNGRIYEESSSIIQSLNVMQENIIDLERRQKATTTDSQVIRENFQTIIESLETLNQKASTSPTIASQPIGLRNTTQSVEALTVGVADLSYATFLELFTTQMTSLTRLINQSATSDQLDRYLKEMTQTLIEQREIYESALQTLVRNNEFLTEALSKTGEKTIGEINQRYLQAQSSFLDYVDEKLLDFTKDIKEDMNSIMTRQDLGAEDYRRMSLHALSQAITPSIASLQGFIQRAENIPTTRGESQALITTLIDTQQNTMGEIKQIIEVSGKNVTSLLTFYGEFQTVITRLEGDIRDLTELIQNPEALKTSQEEMRAQLIKIQQQQATAARYQMKIQSAQRTLIRSIATAQRLGSTPIQRPLSSPAIESTQDTPSSSSSSTQQSTSQQPPSTSIIRRRVPKVEAKTRFHHVGKFTGTPKLKKIIRAVEGVIKKEPIEGEDQDPMGGSPITAKGLTNTKLTKSKITSRPAPRSTVNTTLTTLPPVQDATSGKIIAK